MTRTIAAHDKSPYPTIGECLRFVVSAFDLRGRGDVAAQKRLDRLANDGDYGWTLFPEILDQMIRQPLAKCTDDEFAIIVARDREAPGSAHTTRSGGPANKASA